MRAPLVLCGLLLFVACDTQPVPTEPTAPIAEPAFDVTTETTDYKYHLVGGGTWCCGTQPAVVINALRKFNGEVAGIAVTPCAGGCTDGARVGNVVELVAPSATYDHWCVNVALDETPGFNALLYVRDVGDGQTTVDELGIGGNFGATCVQYPTPGFGFLFPLISGDFNGDVKSK